MPLNLERISYPAPLLTLKRSCKRFTEKFASSGTMAVSNGNTSRQKLMNFLMRDFERILVNILDVSLGG